MRRRGLAAAALVAVLGACGTGGDGGDGPDASGGASADASGGASADASSGDGPDAAGGDAGENRADAAGGGDLYDELDPELQDLFDIINEERSAHGVGPVTLRADLNCAAQLHADDVGPKALCQHEGTDGSQPPERVADCGGTLGVGGETIACGAPTARGAVDSWLSSTAGHREMMLGANRREIGVGVANNFWVAVWAD